MPEGPLGRPLLDISTAHIEELLNRQYKLKDIAALYQVPTSYSGTVFAPSPVSDLNFWGLQCDPRTVSRRLKASGSSFRHRLSQAEIVSLAEEHCHISENGRAAGHRMVQAALFSRAGARPARQNILSALRQHDPAGTAARQERIIPRGLYSITQALVVWHIDCKSFPSSEKAQL